MRVKTSVTLPSESLEEINRDARDAAILDRVAEELNQQSDVLDFQGLPE